ncbi:hypothetical protein ACSNOK_13065 [Streptomyces sp. URMC 126]|uniref:hypothetical protein n=1 Tax=Streptomyces sp. URMC 126 TaxID=3423401 RepID=UPI003F1D78F6
MTVFLCAKCGAELTPDLRRLAQVPDVSTHDKDRDSVTGLAPSTVPRGAYVIDREPWGAPFVTPEAQDADARAMGTRGSRGPLMPPGMTDMVPRGPQGSVIVHPEDVRGLRPAESLGIHHGCCGPLGTGGPNMACACGAFVATLAADCMGPHELRLHPLRVYAFPAGTPT